MSNFQQFLLPLALFFLIPQIVPNTVAGYSGEVTHSSVHSPSNTNGLELIPLNSAIIVVTATKLTQNDTGLPTELEVIFPDTLIPGEDFVLEAYPYHPEGTKLYQTGGTPIANEAVTFSIEIAFDNGTNHNANETVLTNIQGIAHFILSRDLTMNIASFLGIEMLYLGSNTYQATSVVIDSPNLPVVQSPTKTQSESVQTPGIDLSNAILGLCVMSSILIVMRKKKRLRTCDGAK